MTERRSTWAQDARQDLRTIKTLNNLNEQMQDLGKSINVYNNNPNVANPFVQSGGAQPPAAAPVQPQTQVPGTPSPTRE